MREGIFAWPFFEPRHRAFAQKLAEWLARAAPHTAGSTEEEAVRQWVRALGDSNHLAACIDHDVRMLCIARQLLAEHDALADFAFAMQGLCAGPIVLFGTPEQRTRYLSLLGEGRSVGAFAITEKNAGSDVSAIETRALQSGSGYVISGEKTFISNAAIADLCIVVARTGESGARGLSAFIVDAGTPGLQCVEHIETISPHPLGTLKFEECRVPKAARIGEEGQGFKITMATLDVFRATVAAAAVGFSRRALRETIAHVSGRRLFGQRLADMQMTQARIAQMATSIDAAALLVYRAAYEKDAGLRVTRQSAMAKLYATETASKVADDAVQLFGARGVTRGEVVERIYRDVRALRIYEGASEIQELVIARSLLEERP